MIKCRCLFFVSVIGYVRLLLLATENVWSCGPPPAVADPPRGRDPLRFWPQRYPFYSNVLCHKVAVFCVKKKEQSNLNRPTNKVTLS